MSKTERISNSFDILVTHSARHCRRFRLSSYDYSEIPQDVLHSIASDMLDLFEQKLESFECAKRVGGECGTHPMGGSMRAAIDRAQVVGD